MKSKVCFFIGIIFLGIAYFINKYHFMRLILLALGIFLITLGYVFKEKRKASIAILLPLFLLVICYCIDHILFITIKRFPIFVYKIESSEKVRTYNSFFYRLIDCDGNITLDNGYKKGYICGNNDLENTDVNVFLVNPDKSYRNFKNKYVKVTGKISKIIGKDTIEMSYYENTPDTLNGYVKFTNGTILKIKTDTDLSKYRIYDDLTAIFLVDDITHLSESTVIEGIDSILLPSTYYDSYSIEVITNEEESLKELSKDKEYYLYGIDNIYLKYKNNTIYELSYVLEDKRLDIDDFIKDSVKKEVKDKNGEIIYTYYELEKFNVYNCQEKTILGNPRLKLNESLCEQIQE